jgi:hypothetical protein
MHRLRCCAGRNTHLDFLEHRLLDLFGDLGDEVRIDHPRRIRLLKGISDGILQWLLGRWWQPVGSDA